MTKIQPYMKCLELKTCYDNVPENVDDILRELSPDERTYVVDSRETEFYKNSSTKTYWNKLHLVDEVDPDCDIPALLKSDEVIPQEPPFGPFEDETLMMTAVNVWGAAHGRFFRLGDRIEDVGQNKYHYPAYHIECFRHANQQSKMKKVDGSETMTSDCPWSAVAIYDVVTDTYNVDYRDCVHNHETHSSDIFPEYVRLDSQLERIREKFRRYDVSRDDYAKLIKQSAAKGLFPPFQSLETRELRKKFQPHIPKGFSPIQALLFTLRKDECAYYKDVDANGKIRALVWGDIWWGSYLRFEAWYQFPDTLSLNFTYQSNEFGMPLMEAMFKTNTGFLHHAFFAFVAGDTEECYTAALKLAEKFCVYYDIERPRYVITGDNPRLRKAVETVWPKTKWMLCSWHLHNDITQYVVKNFEHRGAANKVNYIAEDGIGAPELPRQSQENAFNLDGHIEYADTRRILSLAQSHPFASQPIFKTKVPKYVRQLLADFAKVNSQPDESMFMNEWHSFESRYGAEESKIVSFLRDNYIARRDRWADYVIHHQRNHGHRCCGKVEAGVLFRGSGGPPTSVWRVYLKAKKELVDGKLAFQNRNYRGEEISIPESVMDVVWPFITLGDDMNKAFRDYYKAAKMAKAVFNKWGREVLPPCSEVLWQQYGCPCVHDFYKALAKRSPITRYGISLHWKQDGGKHRMWSTSLADKMFGCSEKRRFEEAIAESNEYQKEREKQARMDDELDSSGNELEVDSSDDGHESLHLSEMSYSSDSE